MRLETARRRSEALRLTRDFFLERGFLEADVPALAPDLIPEANIATFRTRWDHPWRGSRDLWLLPSPERYLKPLLAEGFPDLFYLGKAYRNAESLGPHHQPEFTLLEWYERDRDELDLMGTLQALVEHLGQTFPLPPALTPPFLKWDLEQLFVDWAGVDWVQAPTYDALYAAASASGQVPPCRSWEDLWDWLFIDRVEPRLPKDRPVILTGWPAAHATQAALDPDAPAKTLRWELYAGGLELVNACRETTSPDRVQRLFDHNLGKMSHPPPASQPYIEACARLGTVSGAALGFDRLLEVLLGASTIGEVIFFPTMGTLGTHE